MTKLTLQPPKATGNSTVTSRSLKVRWVPVRELKPYPANARRHSDKQIRQIASSIERFGWTNPILVDGEGSIIAGHGRAEAAKLLGLIEVPTIGISDLTEAQVRAYIIADNRLAECAGWDEAILATELQFLTSIDCDFDVTVTGFEAPEIDLLIQSLDEAPGEAEDLLPEIPDDSVAISRPGDLWFLGEHRLLCGDAQDPVAYETLMDGKLARMVFTDPPYNVPIDGHVCGLGAIKHREFAMAVGEMSEVEFTAFLQSVLSRMSDVSLDGSLHFICMDWRHLLELLTAGRAVYSELKNFCIWAKTNGGMGSLYRSQHEEVLVFKKGKVPHVNNVQLGRFGRNRSNLWTYEGTNSLNDRRRADLALHPTVKPVSLVADAIQDCSHRGEIVLDPFGGSGTTIMAAERAGRRAHVIEIDPLYVDCAIRRWETLTGRSAHHAELDLSFAEVATLRASADEAPLQRDPSTAFQTSNNEEGSTHAR